MHVWCFSRGGTLLQKIQLLIHELLLPLLIAWGAIYLSIP